MLLSTKGKDQTKSFSISKWW